jgi:UDP-N-acetylmuramyl pentapeptide synthase
MFQLNSYSADTQIKWVLNHKTELVVPGIALVCSAYFTCLEFVAWTKVLTMLLFLIWGIRNVRKKAKKKLVYTPRVIRMLISNMIIVTMCSILAFTFIEYMWFPVLESTYLFMVPIVLIFSNWINAPIERLINLRYINEAKSILKEATNLKIIGVTGSYGKTSVKYFLASLLQSRYDVLKTPGNYNTILGVVKTIREMYSPINQIFVCEMGARRVGEIKEICDLVHPDAGIITAIGPQHLETFKTLEHIKETKFELANSLKPSSYLFLNGDDENVIGFPHSNTAIIFGIQNHDGYYADHITVNEKGSKFMLHTPNGEQELFSTSLLGHHNVLNIVGAIAVAHTFDIPLKDLVVRVRKLEGAEHRLQFIRNQNGAIIDDAYNSNPQGTKAALEVLSMFDGIKILVTPGMVELGVQEEELNYSFGQDAAKVCDYIVLVGEAQTQPIYKGIISVGYPKEKVYVASSFNDAMQSANSFCEEGRKKYILIENDLPDNY